jgi:hypothetical protein
MINRPRNRLFPLLTILLITLSACRPLSVQSETENAEAAARKFFQLLTDGEYQAAQAMYAGDYSELRYLNLSISADDHAVLWRNACEVNGFQCLPIRQIVQIQKQSLNEYFMIVEFENPDGGLFVLGPYCGASEGDMSPVSQFEVYIIERSGEYLVVSLPVLVP